jgi:hypothetical protein
LIFVFDTLQHEPYFERFDASLPLIPEPKPFFIICSILANLDQLFEKILLTN